MFFRDGIQVIDRFKEARLGALAGLVDGFFDWLLDTVDGFGNLTRHFNFLGYLFVGPVDAGDIGEEIKGELSVVAQKCCDGNGGLWRQAQRVLR